MANCVTNQTYFDAALQQADAIRSNAWADAAIMTALALWDRFASDSVSNMEREEADAMMRIAEAIQAHAEKFYPAEKALVDEIFANRVPQNNYVGMGSQWMLLASEATNEMRLRWLAMMESMCRTPSLCADARWRRDAGLTEVDAGNAAFREEENRNIALKDRDFSRKYAALGLGRGYLPAIRSFAELSGRLTPDIAGFINGSINSAGQAIGYMFTGPGIFDPWGEQTISKTPSVPNVEVVMPVIPEPKIGKDYYIDTVPSALLESQSRQRRTTDPVNSIGNTEKAVNKVYGGGIL